MSDKLSTIQAVAKIKVTDFRGFGKPKKNKGSRGQLIEKALGLPNSSKLTDLVDGEIKSFTVGETISVTSLKHCLSEIVDNSVEFEDSKVGQKLAQTIYVGFTRDNDYVGTELLNEEVDPQHYQQLAEDFSFIAANVKYAVDNNLELNQLGFTHHGRPTHTITGPNKLLQIRTKASKNKHGKYTSLCYNDVMLNNKGMAFYLLADFGKKVIK